MPLTIVATPLGNLGDITARALDALRECDLIACEDTRSARRLLAAFGLPGKPMASYGEHNEARAAEALLPRLRAGEKIALISEGGTPLISDPGYRIVAACRQEGIPVIGAPGPCAAVLALSVSGLPVHGFLFRGFPPKKPGARRRLFEDLKTRPETLIFYVPANRLAMYLVEFREVFGDRNACVARELTKLHEDVRTGPLSALAEHYRQAAPKGECTVLVEGLGRSAREDGEPEGLAQEDEEQQEAPQETAPQHVKE